MEGLFEKLKSYGEGSVYPYHMPGHKRRSSVGIPAETAGMDITEIDGFDNLHDPKEILKELQEKAAKLYGAEESFYMVNGSTGGILSAVSAALPEGGHILMARNCHKSAYHAAYLRKLKISYLYPPMLEEYGICDAITPEQVDEALNREQEIDAVLLVSPTYEGRVADIRAIVKEVHKRGIPLIVDEAHGAHLGFEKHFAENSCKCGADIVIHSVHKTMPALTQAALLHVNGKMVDRDLLKRFLHIYQTSSPSYLLMASIDNALNFAEQEGEKRFSLFAEKYLDMLEQLSACRHLRFLSGDKDRQDLGKLVISVKKTKLSGQQLYDILLQEEHLQLEMACASYCLAMFTVSDGDEACERMTKALLRLDEQLGREALGEKQEGADTECIGRKMPADIFFTGTDSAGAEVPESIPLCEAWDRETEMLPLEQAKGRYVGEFVNLYPPGTPLLVPGEVFSDEAGTLLDSYLKQGLNVQGVVRLQETHYIKVLT